MKESGGARGSLPRILCGPLLAAIFLLFLVVSAQSQQIDLDVAGAEMTTNVGGRPAITVTLGTESRRAFAAFSIAAIGRSLEVRFAGDVLDTVVLRTPILGGRIQLLENIGKDDKAAETVRKLSSNGAKLEIRVVDEKR